MPEWAQLAFSGYKTLNRIQSRIYTTAFTSNQNMLVCAPTGEAGGEEGGEEVGEGEGEEEEEARLPPPPRGYRPWHPFLAASKQKPAARPPPPASLPRPLPPAPQARARPTSR